MLEDLKKPFSLTLRFIFKTSYYSYTEKKIEILQYNKPRL